MDRLTARGHDSNSDAHLVRVRSHGNAERARKPEVGELEVVIRIDQQILRLEVAMQDAVRVAIEQPGRQLVGKFLSRDLARRALVKIGRAHV